MSRAVMLSIRPKWCEKIINGEKTVEVRKNRPKLETPFTCYIYCTKDAKMQWWKSPQYSYADDHSHNAFDKCGNGKVIGEFICDAITPLFNVCTDNWHHLAGDVHEWHKELVKRACLTDVELKSYSKGKNCFAWHISDLKIYDKPKELDEFWVYNEALHKRYDAETDFCCYDGSNEYGEALTDCGDAYNKILNCYRCWSEWSGWCHRVTRSPQSWCYVEEI